MISFLEWKLALRNLLRNKRRSLSTGFALIVAYVGIALLAGFVIKTEKALSTLIIYGQHLGHVSIYKKDGVENFEVHPDQYQIAMGERQSLKEILKEFDQQVEMMGEFLSTTALLSTGPRSIPVIVQGLTPELDNFVRHHPIVLRWGKEALMAYSTRTFSDAVKEIPDGISISKGVSELLGRTQEMETYSASERELLFASRTLEGDLNAVNATMAVKHTTGMPYLEDLSVRAPLSLLQELLQTQGISHMVLFLKPESNAETLVKVLQRKITDRGLPLEAMTFKDDRVGRYYNGIMNFLFVMVTFFGILILSASGLIIINSITMSVLERTKEMGTLRALGFTPKRVRTLFVCETFWLALISGLLGILMSFLSAQAINSLDLTYDAPGVSYPINLKLIIEPWVHISMMLTIIAVAVLCSVLVVRRKTKVRIASLLLDSGASL